MQKELPPGAIVATVVVVVCVLGFILFRIFGPRDTTSSNMSQSQLQAMQASKASDMGHSIMGNVSPPLRQGTGKKIAP